MFEREKKGGAAEVALPAHPFALKGNVLNKMDPVPHRLPSNRLAHYVVATSVALSALMGASSGLTARESVVPPTPFEISMSPAGNYLSALSAGAQRDTAAAAAYFREALRHDPRNGELMERAFVAALANGNMDDAFSLADRLVKRDARNGLSQLVLGIRAMKQKKYAQAREAFAKGGGGRQRDVTATLLSAWTFMGSGNVKGAVEAIDQLKDERFRLFRDYHAALMLDAAGRKQEAAKRISSVYEQEKSTIRIVDAYARIMARNGRNEEALAAYDAFERLLPRHPVMRAGAEAVKAGKPLPPFVANAEQGASEVLYGLGSIGGRQSDDLASLIYLRMALSLDNQHGLALATLADVYERMKQNEQAIRAYEMVPPSSPLYENAEVQIGLLLEAAGRPEDAQKHLTALVAQRPKDVEAVLALANLQRSRKQFAEAAETYTRALALSSGGRSDWSTYYARGISFERAKQWPKAEADFKKALELYPDQPLVLNYLGYSWVDQGINVPEAFKMLRRAVELRPTDGYIIDSLGWAYYRLGQYPEAVRELEKAIELKASDPVINDHLGDAYWRVGRKLEAKFQWNHARDLNPEPEDLEKILIKIEKGLDDEPATARKDAPKDGG